MPDECDFESTYLCTLRELTPKLSDRDDLFRKQIAILRSILNASPIGIALVKHRHIEWTNPRMGAILGYTQEELKGKPFEYIYPTREEYEEAGKVLYADLWRAEYREIRSRWKRKDNIVIDVLIRVAPVEGGEADMIVVASVLDLKAIAELCKDYILATCGGAVQHGG
jgi:PAS domain S-box-containing protein